MAWDDVKTTNSTLTASEWNAQITDQKERIYSTEKGAAGGVATLGSDGYVPEEQINPEVILTSAQRAGIISATTVSASNPVVTRDDIRRIVGRKFI